jgi:hypothetical protein
MAGTSDTSIFVLLADAYRLFLERAGRSEKLANKLVQRFLEEGERDRDGRIRYKIWLVEAVPGGTAPSPYSGDFWRSYPERGISCVIEPWHSSACWTGPASPAWRAVHGREVSSYQVAGIRLNHEAVLEFLESAGLPAKSAQPGEPGEPSAVPQEQPAPPPPEKLTRLQEMKRDGFFKRAPAAQAAADYAREAYPPHGCVPDDVTPAQFAHGLEDWLQADDKKKAISDQWQTSNRFLQEYRRQP